MSIILYVQAVSESNSYGEVHPCSICRVPNELRDLKEDAYTPKSIFIGLLHRGETSHRQVQLIVDIKWHYMDRFLRQENRQNVPGTFMSRLRACSEGIPKIEIDIRASYDGNILGSEITADVIGRKMVLDGCFLLQLLPKLEYPTIDTRDPIFETEEKMRAAVNDITLLENQIPFIVLKVLYRKTLGENFVPKDGDQVAQEVEVQNDHRVAEILQRAFGYPFHNTTGCAHILDFMHFSTVEDSRNRDANPAKQELVRCATKLLAAGIIIIPVRRHQEKQNPDIIPGRRHQAEQNPELIDLTDTFDFNISLDNGKLGIPVLKIKETTEVRWRNLIAWEQSKVKIRCKYTSYALFFKGLICCESDIELLQKNGVIVLDGCDRSKEDLMTLFSTISKGAEHMDSSFTNICTRLNEHMSMKFTTIVMRWPRLIRHKLRLGYETSRNFIREGWRDFCREMQSTHWKIVGVLAATVLIILTTLQTIYTMRS